MKGTSKVIMGATLVMVVSLAIVLALVLVLLAELYCTLLLRLRRTPSNSTTAIPPAVTSTPTANTSLSESPQTQKGQNQSLSSPLSSYYAHGVLQAPRNFLFPAIYSKENNVAAETRGKHSQLHHILEVHTQESNTSPYQKLGLINPSPPSASLVSSPHQIQEIPVQTNSSNNSCNDKVCAGCGEHFVYISNPIYDNDANRPISRVDTPYETPDSSPSHLEAGGSSGDDEIPLPSPSSPASLPITPPLTPMKKLPAEACSVSLRDARSLGTSGSDSVSNNGLSSSSSGSLCTSPSW